MATKRFTESPAGDKIDIIPDAEWVRITGDISDKGLRQWSGMKPAVIRFLWNNGAVEDNKSGQATRKLYRAMQEAGYRTIMPAAITSLTSMFSAPTNAPAFLRDTNGKRTYMIKLVALPEKWHNNILRDEKGKVTTYKATPTNGTHPPTVVASDPVSTREPASVAIPATEAPYGPNWQPIPAEVADVMPGPTLSVDIASQVAMALLNKVVAMVTAEPSNGANKQLQHELTLIQERLGARNSENERLRQQLRDSGDRINALTSERDGLRMRLRQVEANLTAAMKGNADIVNGEVRKEIDRLMRAAPTSKGD